MMNPERRASIERMEQEIFSGANERISFLEAKLAFTEKALAQATKHMKTQPGLVMGVFPGHPSVVVCARYQAEELYAYLSQPNDQTEGNKL